MRVRLFSMVLLAAAAVAFAPPQHLGKVGVARAAVRDFDERDESRQSYGLAPGATLEINSVSGDVTVETADISQAEVEIVRTARTREDLRCREFKVSATPERLRLDGNDERRECRNVHVNQTLNLRVPRRLNLDVNSVSGSVRVGELDGWVTLNSISGNAIVARAAGEARVNSVSGRVSVNLSRLGGGVSVNSVSGSVDVGLPDGANADITVRSVTGDVIADVPGMTLQKMQNSDYEGRVGAGGTALTFNSITGNVRFHRASQ
ncbi:MAG: DUF4097 domain-containing protein [Acidobacteriota bacterium]|nr:DUF4097 domain-containing protein [Acidobacteriota bacterium]